MGLDMYLHKRNYVKNWDHNPEEEKHDITVKRGGVIRQDIKPERIAYIIEEIGYWRKFNSLHGWLVNNCADGVDDCKEFHVNSESIKELLEILNKVVTIVESSPKETKVLKDWKGNDYEHNTYDCQEEINELFPPSEGFFFGGNDIDDYYLNDVKKSIEIFQSALNDILNDEAEITYRASW